ncbi:MAG: hypothetical protein KF853_09540 [Rhodocyclaceae bacterium]|nr:hypothetical protein [Rhodocyclaceae bacterium]
MRNPSFHLLPNTNRGSKLIKCSICIATTRC